MRRFPIVAFALLASIAAALPMQASAQNAVAELVRKARAGEKDNGFCAGSGLEKLEFAEVQPRINQLLSQSDAAVRVAWAIAGGGDTICFHFVFAAPAQRANKKCRATETYACRAGQDCQVQAADFICEVRPGQWD